VATPIAGRKGRIYGDISTDGTGAAVPIANLNSYSLNASTDKIEVTSFGDTSKSYVVSLPDAQGDLSGFWDTDGDQYKLSKAIDGGRKFCLRFVVPQFRRFAFQFVGVLYALWNLIVVVAYDFVIRPEIVRVALDADASASGFRTVQPPQLIAERLALSLCPVIIPIGSELGAVFTSGGRTDVNVIACHVQGSFVGVVGDTSKGIFTVYTATG
jgi:hypothetical protein